MRKLLSILTAIFVISLTGIANAEVGVNHFRTTSTEPKTIKADWECCWGPVWGDGLLLGYKIVYFTVDSENKFIIKSAVTGAYLAKDKVSYTYKWLNSKIEYMVELCPIPIDPNESVMCSVNWAITQ